MGMIMAVLGGFLAIILGIIGLIFWFKDFLYPVGRKYSLNTYYWRAYCLIYRYH